ncbi:MAG TPA: hypothetical protein VGF75_03260 [Candidatus Saccharimonadales bacterium]|jgi:hypothetical protein
MKQIKAVLEIRYDQMPELFAYKNKVVRALGGTDAEKQASLVENVNIQAKDQFAHISVEPYRLLISVERREPKKAQEYILGVYEKVDNLLHLSSVKQVGYRCMFTEESDDSFKDLVSRQKTAFFKDTAIAADATDVAMPLTLKIDDYRVNFQSGAVKPDELKERLEYKDLNVKNSYLIDLDFIKYNLSISRRSLKQHIEEIRNYQKSLISKWEEAIYE